MSELEMEIGRILGASAFYIYQFIKHNPGATSRDIQVETGLSEDCVWRQLIRLRESNVLQYTERTAGYRKSKMYKENTEKSEWKFH